MSNKQLCQIRKFMVIHLKEWSEIYETSIKSAKNHGVAKQVIFVGEKGRKAFLKLIKELKRNNK